jgi:hypothetical protein
MTDAITITHSTPADGQEITRLALLDGRRAPAGPALLAYVDGELRAAVGLVDGQAIADPFHPTAELVEILRFQARQEVAA